MSTSALHTKSELPLSVGNPYIVQSETNGFAGDEENSINLKNLNKKVKFSLFWYDYFSGDWTITEQQYYENNNILSNIFEFQTEYDADLHFLNVEATADTNIQEDLTSEEEPFIESTQVDLDDLEYVAMCMFGLHRSNIQDHIPSRVWKFTITDRYGRPLN
jgi:hypothetical protein